MKYNENFIEQFLAFEAELRKMEKAKKVKYNKRFKAQACPVCGSRNIHYGTNRAEYPEVWSIDRCADCGCVVGYQDNSPYFTIWDELKRVRSKKKVLAIVQEFYDGANGDITKIL